MDEPLELIVGLGNPGLEHRRARHNAGFWFADWLAGRHGGEFRVRRRLFGDMAEVTLAGRRLRLLKPMTYMNDSGRSVAAAVAFYKTPPQRMMVAYDELDLAPGRAKFRFDGGHGGHNGVRSIAERVGREFWRLRLGIGHPGPGLRERVVRYVLKRPTPEEQGAILDTMVAAAEALEVFVEKGAERARTLLHSRRPDESAPGGLNAGRAPGGPKAGRAPERADSGQSPRGAKVGRAPERADSGQSPGGPNAGRAPGKGDAVRTSRGVDAQRTPEDPDA